MNSKKAEGQVPDHSPMSWGCDEIQAAVHSAVRHLPSVHTRLCVQIILKLTVDVINDRLPAGAENTGDSGHAFDLKKHHSNENTIT